MKEVQYGYALTRARELLRLTQARMEQLEEVLGTEAPLVSAEWDRGENAAAHPVVTLRLSDWTGWATAVFEPKELESAPHMRIRFYRVWGDLLQVRSHKLIERLTGGDQ